MSVAGLRAHTPVDEGLIETYAGTIREVHRDLTSAFVACMRDWQARRPDSVRLDGVGAMARAFIRLQPDYGERMRVCPREIKTSVGDTSPWYDAADDDVIMFTFSRRGAFASQGEPHVTVMAYASDLGATMGRIA